MNDIFCWTCGNKLVLVKTVIRCYSTLTGQEFVTHIWKCPQRKWFAFWHTLDYHV